MDVSTTLGEVEITIELSTDDAIILALDGELLAHTNDNAVPKVGICTSDNQSTLDDYDDMPDSTAVSVAVGRSDLTTLFNDEHDLERINYTVGRSGTRTDPHIFIAREQ